jgi:dTDP-4-amino-4,6-dideoxygalactose transaminase
MSEPIAFVDLLAMHAEIADEVDRGFAEVLATGAFVGGRPVELFEEEFAAFSGRAACVGLGNGTDAIEFALRAVGVGAGDEVIVPANTFVASVEAVARAGATPVLVDVDPGTLLVDVAAVEAAVGPRTAAILPVHLYGQMALMDDIQKVAARHSLAVVEDAAQAQGATRHGAGIGAGSAIAATSFYPGKNLGAYGDGGGVVTDDRALARAVRLLGSHGSERKYEHESLGFNSRLDTLQAVVLRAKLRRLEEWNSRRRAAADRYLEGLAGSGVGLPVVAEGNSHVWHLFVVRVPDGRRGVVMDALAAESIGVGIHYPIPVHLQPAFGSTSTGRGAFPESEAAADEIVSLPMHPGLTTSQVDRVVEAVITALR